MTINFLDFIIFSLLQYSTAMVLKSSKFINIHNPYKARREFDYNYKDWEEKKTDIYDYLLSSTNQTSTTASDIFTETTTQKMYHKEIPDNLTLGIPEFSKWLSSSSSSTTYSTIPSTEPTPDSSLPIPDTSLPIPDTGSTPLPSTPFNTTTTTLITEYSNGNIISITTTPSTVTTLDPVNQLIRNEIEEARAKLRGGMFTASVYVLLKIIERKKSADVKSLLDGLRREFARLNNNYELDVFGPMVSTVSTAMVELMATSPIELIQLQSKNGQDLIENKREEFQANTKAIFIVVDAIYTEEDSINIVESLKNIQNFPNVPKSEKDVAKEAIESFIFIPYSRIRGTGKEVILLNELHNVVEKRIFIEDMPVTTHYRKYFEIPGEMTTSSENIIKFENTIFTKAEIKKGFVEPTSFTEPTTINSFESDDKSYFKDLKIMKHKMRFHTDKFSQSRSKEKKNKTSRELTSTATTKSTRFTWGLFGKNRKFMDDNFKTKKYLLSNGSSDTEDFYSDNNYGITRFENKSEITDSSAESYLQIKLKDALFHKNNMTIHKRFMKKRFNKLRYVDSFSDDEAILKSNIYKAFGYSKDFAKQIKAIL